MPAAGRVAVGTRTWIQTALDVSELPLLLVLERLSNKSFHHKRDCSSRRKERKSSVRTYRSINRANSRSS
jgi:hypothetical protein